MDAVRNALQPLEWKFPSCEMERQLASVLALSIDATRFMLAFFAACACGLALRNLSSAQGAMVFAARERHTRRCPVAAAVVAQLCAYAGQEQREHRAARAGRRIFSVVSGAALCVYVFGAGTAHGVASVLLNYALLRLAPKHAGLVAWIVNFPHLALWSATPSSRPHTSA